MLIGVSLYWSNDVFIVISLSFYIAGHILQNTLQDLSQLSLIPLSTHLLRESMWLRTQSALHGKALMRGRILQECDCLPFSFAYISAPGYVNQVTSSSILSAGYYTSETGEQNCVVYRAVQT